MAPCALEHHGDRPMWYRLLPSRLLCGCSLGSVPYHPKQGGWWFSPSTTSETVGLLELHREAWVAQSMLDQKVQGESAHKCWEEKREGAGSQEAHLPHPQSNGHRRLRDLFLVCIWIQACLFLFSAVRALKRTLCLVVLVLPSRGLEQNTDYSHFLLKKNKCLPSGHSCTGHAGHLGTSLTSQNFPGHQLD